MAARQSGPMLAVVLARFCSEFEVSVAAGTGAGSRGGGWGAVCPCDGPAGAAGGQEQAGSPVPPGQLCKGGVFAGRSN